MSVLIRGMKMQKDCYECELPSWNELEDYYECPFFIGRCPANSRRDDCPLVELPEKHGRLIDADALLNIYSNRFELVSERYGLESSELGILCGAMKLLDSQPVVIEAEE